MQHTSKTRCSMATRKQRRMRAVRVALLLACGSQGAWAGDGAVALQTAQPACPDNTTAVYVDCGNGTVTDNRSGLVWLANANCVPGADWQTAMEFVAGLSDKPDTPPPNLADHDCGLSDGSSPGEWRLPSVEEWQAMMGSATSCVPAIWNDAGTDCWGVGASSFTDVVAANYWSSSTFIGGDLLSAWNVALQAGIVSSDSKIQVYPVWPVRGGQ